MANHVSFVWILLSFNMGKGHLIIYLENQSNDPGPQLPVCLHSNTYLSLPVVTCACNASTWKDKAGGAVMRLRSLA